MSETKKNLSPKELTPEQKAIDDLARSRGITHAAAAAKIAHDKLPEEVRNPPRPKPTPAAAAVEDATETKPEPKP
jgi:hypothetical protein